MVVEQERVAVLGRDPDLGAGLSAEALAAARRHVTAQVRRVPRGRWIAGSADLGPQNGLGLLVLDGLLVRRVIAHASKACGELLGSGDVLAPWHQAATGSSVTVGVEWEVVEPLQVAILDREFALRIARWPEITAAITGRLMSRAQWLAFHLAVCQIRRVDRRLLLVLWRLADRWGRMTPRGVELSIALSHSLLASLVATRRPAVSLALQGLVESGALERRSRSHWTLHGEPPGLAMPVPEVALSPQVTAGEAVRLPDAGGGSVVTEDEPLHGLGEPLLVV